MESIWQKDVTMPTFPTLSGDERTEVLIIGGGIAGLLTAYFLHKRGVRYILVEKHRICAGTTGHTTAKITVQHGLVYHKLCKSRGAEAARAYLGANGVAFRRFAELCEQIDCDYEPCDHTVYSTHDRRALEEEMRALERIDATAELCERLPLPLETVGGIRFAGQAQFHPLKFLSSIASNLNIYENTQVLSVSDKQVLSNRGTITAERIVVATHFPFLNRHGSYFLKLYQHRSYVLALQNAPKLDGMYVDGSGNGLSFRNYGDHLLLGGGGHRTGKQGGDWRELRAFAAAHYPDAVERFAWAAQDCMSLDAMPYVGVYSRRTPRLLVASGFCKWGMTGAMLAAILLADAVIEKRNEYAPFFAPSRSIFTKQLAVNGWESARNLLSLTPKRCSHLGCALKWNRAEHTWDCPCHGSRFAEDGHVIDNPANRDLKE